MKYHNNGVLRNDPDTTLWLKPGSRKQKLTCVEYLPIVVLIFLMAGLLLTSLFA